MKETILLLLVALVQSESDGTTVPLSLEDIFQDSSTDTMNNYMVQDAGLQNEISSSLPDTAELTDLDLQPIVRKRSTKDSLSRRSALDKNFMRFGKRSGAPTFFPDSDSGSRQIRLRNLMRFTRGGGTNDNFMRFGRAKTDQFMRFGKSKDNFMRFGRGGGTGSGDNFMRFGKAADNFMRFGKAADNFMRFGKGSDNFMRFGRGDKDNFMRFGRGDKDNFMRFGRAKDNFMRFGRAKDNFMRFGRAKDNFMRFGRAKDNFMRFGRSKDNFMRFGRGDEEEEESGNADEETVRRIEEDLLMRSGRGDNRTDVRRDSGFLRFGRNMDADGKDEHDVADEVDVGDLELSAEKLKQGPVVRVKRTLGEVPWGMKHQACQNPPSYIF